MPTAAEPKVCARAGAITAANSSGVITGISSSRGVRAVSASRRRASVATAGPRPLVRGGAVATSAGRRMVDEAMVMEGSFGLVGTGDGGRSGGEGLAGELQVDVVERGGTAGHGARGDAALGDGRDGVGAVVVAHRDVRGVADDEHVGRGDPAGQQRGDGRADVAVDAALDELVAEGGEE